LEPLNVGDADGIYLLCRLTSDEEPERRAWKVTTRSEQSRGELVYQVAYKLPKNDGDDWAEIMIPFSDFQLVRGPRLVEGGAALNVTNGIYQIGLSLSKFTIAQNMTEIDNFRPGYFELQLKEVGVYKKKVETALTVSSPQVLSKDEANKKRPIFLKFLLPLAKIFFNEKR
jgi:hypothetical protein